MESPHVLVLLEYILSLIFISALTNKHYLRWTASVSSKPEIKVAKRRISLIQEHPNLPTRSYKRQSF